MLIQEYKTFTIFDSVINLNIIKIKQFAIKALLKYIIIKIIKNI